MEHSLQTINSFGYVVPEILLLLVTLAMLLVGVFIGNSISQLFIRFSALFFVVLTLLTYATAPDADVILFDGLYVTGPFTAFAKILVLIGAALIMNLTLGYAKDYEKKFRFEFPILILFAVLGMVLMVSANDLLSLYVSIELQSLCLYVLAALGRHSEKSAEAGVKYFVLGALASGLLLYGCSLIYGFTGTTSFANLSELYHLSSIESLPLGVLLGLVFVIVALCFKVSAVPFHMWTPDVYEGAPTPITAFFAIAPKVAALILFARLLTGPFIGIVDQWQQVIIFVSAVSMVIGALGALMQRNIKRLLAYSSIGHVGYALVGLAAGTQEGLEAILVYLSIYLVMNIGMWACVMMMRQGETAQEEISGLAGLSRTHPLFAFGMVILLFSMAGIPPLAGFFAKFYIFKAAIDAELFTLAVIGVLSSVLAAYYYIRIVKIMYFDEVEAPLTSNVSKEILTIASVSCIVVLFFFLFPTPLVSAAEKAVSAIAGL